MEAAARVFLSSLFGLVSSLLSSERAARKPPEPTSIANQENIEPHRWRAGQSGNPAGRKRKVDITATIDDVLSETDVTGKTAVRELIEELKAAAIRGLREGDPACFNALAKYIGIVPTADNSQDQHNEIRVTIVEHADDPASDDDPPAEASPRTADH